MKTMKKALVVSVVMMLVAALLPMSASGRGCLD
jgi:hypothetical protein